MRSRDEHKNWLDGTAFRELRLLEEVEATPDISQRNLAHRLGVALGVANLLLGKMATKGQLRINRVGWRQWIYSLTPSGVAHKVKLTLGYVDRFLNHYDRVRLLLRQDLAELGLNVESRVAIYGTSGLAELTYLGLRDFGIEEIEVYDEDGKSPVFLGIPVKPLTGIAAEDFSVVVVAKNGDFETHRRTLASAGVPESEIVLLMRSSERSSSDDTDEISSRAL